MNRISRCFKIIGFILLISSLGGTVTYAGPLEDANWLLRQGRYEEAADSAAPLAQGGDAEAQYIMGTITSEPKSSLFNTQQAVGWFMKSAEQSYIPAQVRLGYLYAIGLYVPQDLDRAIQYDRAAAAQGDTTAKNNLAFHLVTMQGEAAADEALHLIDEAIAAEPNEATFLDTKGWILYLLNRPGDALPWLCRAVRLDGGHPESMAHLGDALWRSGWSADAKERWELSRAMLKGKSALSQLGQDYVRADSGMTLLKMLMQRQENAEAILGATPVKPLVDLPPECAPPTS
jgi:TPR repeat protein